MEATKVGNAAEGSAEGEDVDVYLAPITSAVTFTCEQSFINDFLFTL